MSFPLSQGSNPETGILTADTWIMYAQNVNSAKIHNRFSAMQTVWITNVLTGQTAPSGLSIPKWKIPEGYDQFNDAISSRDLYAYAKDKDAEVTVEA